MIINGRKVVLEDTVDVVNPSTEDVIAHIPLATRFHLNEAVESAFRAFQGWSRTSIQTRQEALSRMGDLMSQYLQSFIELLMTEVGKSRELAYVDLPTLTRLLSYRTFSSIEAGSCPAWFHALSLQSLPEETLLENGSRKVVTRYTPHGVVGSIMNCSSQLSLTKPYGKT